MTAARKLSQAPPSRILLADDNHYGNAARKAVLEEQGFLVESVLSGEEALNVCHESHFDLVVTDLKMKKMSGLELIARLRELEHPPLLILLSGWALCLGLTEESSGADAVLAKSNKEQDQLMRAIRQLLARRPRRKPAKAEKIAPSPVARSGVSVHRLFETLASARRSDASWKLFLSNAGAVRRAKHAKAPPATPLPISGIPQAWKKMTLRDEVAQLIVVPFTGQPLKKNSKPWRELTGFVKTQHVGGLILVNVMQGRLVQRADPVEAATVINSLQKLAKIPLVVGGDLERGASMRFKDTTIFPHAMAFAAAGDPSAARYEGAVTAREARTIGVNWVFFPDADVNSNPDNPIINIRSYSEDPAQVSTYVTAFLQGATENPKYRVLTTVKHFPGHGDTSVDTHLNMASIPADRKHLDNVELVPFKAAIAKDVDSVMTAHLAVPALGTGDLPATLSPMILTQLLRMDLGFKGLIVTDAMEMGGIAKGFAVGDAAVRAIQAGADVILMPSDPVAAIDAITAAVLEGRITKGRIDQSVERLLRAKMRIGLTGSRYVDIKAIPREVNQPEPNQRALEIAQKAVTLVKKEDQLVPITPGRQVCFAMLREGASSQQGLAMQPELNRRAPGRPALMLDAGMPEADLDRAVEQAGSCDAWYVAAYVSVAGYRGNVALTGSFPALLTKLIASGKPVMLISLGNPYLLRSFPNVAGYMTTFSTVPPSEIAAVQALYGEIPIQGRLPVSIPDLAKFGDGIVSKATLARSPAVVPLP